MVGKGRRLAGPRIGSKRELHGIRGENQTDDQKRSADEEVLPPCFETLPISSKLYEWKHPENREESIMGILGGGDGGS